MPPPPYLTHLFPSTQVHRVRFTPFDDTLGVGHARGFETLIVPGAGEPNYDSREADPYESKRRRREREVNSLLDKVPMDLITLDQDVLGRVDRDAIRPRAGAAGAAGSLRKQGAAAAAEVPFAKKSRAERLQLQGRAALAEDEELSSSDEDDADVDEDAARRAAQAQKRIEMADNKNRMRGKSSGIKKALRKRRRNVIDPQTVSRAHKHIHCLSFRKFWRTFRTTPAQLHRMLYQSALLLTLDSRLVRPRSLQVALKEKLERQREANKRAKANKLAQEQASSGTQSALDRFSAAR